MVTRRRFTADFKARVALEALRGRQDDPGDCDEAQGSSEPSEHMEASGD